MREGKRGAGKEREQLGRVHHGDGRRYILYIRIEVDTHR